MDKPIYRILLLLIIGALSIGYVYIAYPLSLESTKNAVNDLVEVARDRRRLIRFSALPDSTVQILLAHDPNADTLTDAEEAVLRGAFTVYDTDMDGTWGLPEFEEFIDDVIEPSKRFDVMDMDDNGVLSLKEIYLTMSAFDNTDIFACADSDQVLLDVFGYDTSPRDNLYYEYLAHLWMYELDQLGMDIISKEKYVKYIEDAEAFYHGYDDDSLVTFDEFKDQFFGSLLYRSFMNAMQIDPSLVADAYAELHAIDDAGVAALELATQHGSMKPTIEAHMNGQTFSAATGYSPTRSLLYAFPLNDVMRRRLHNSAESIQRCEQETDATRACKFTMSNCECSCRCLDCNWNKRPYRLFQTNGTAGNCDCFAGDGAVTILVDGIVQEKQLKDVSAGDYVFDGTDYSKVIAVEQRDEKIKMMKVHLNDNSDITMTANHLLYNGQSELMQAGKLKIGDKLLNDLVVVDVEFGLYESPLNALTMSGKIEVNGVSASCYAFSSDFAVATHRVMAPFRFLSEYVSEYYTAKAVESMVFGTARAISLGGQIGASLGLPAFVNVFIITLLVPLLFAKQFFVFCFSQYSVMEFGQLMSQHLSL